MVIVETKDAILIADKSKTQEVKKIVEELKKTKQKELIEHITVFRPWGSYTVLEEAKNYKVKKIVVNPKEKLSLQSHCFRSEHWIVIKGRAKITNNNKVFYLKEKESTFIPCKTKHCLENPGTSILEIIEVQNGTYLGEDDIIRFEDKYKRI